jgi:hypothetical protein
MSSDSCYGLFGCQDSIAQEGLGKTNLNDLTAAGIDDSFKSAKSCCVCKLENIKYRCPGCQLRTCSLACVKKHKNIFKCNGKRDRVPFVKLSDFDEKTFIDDYFLLEETESVIERAVRVRQSVCKSLWTRSNVSPLHKMRKKSVARESRLKFLHDKTQEKKSRSNNQAQGGHQEDCDKEDGEVTDDNEEESYQVQEIKIERRAMKSDKNVD